MRRVTRNLRTYLGVLVAMVAVLLLFLPADHVKASGVPWSARSVGDVIASFAGLDFTAFIETSYREYLLRFPEWITQLGIPGNFGVRNDALNDYSEAYIEDTQSLERAILDRLHGYDRSSLYPSEQLSYDVFLSCFDDRVRGQTFALYDYPITHYYITSLHWAFFDLLTEVEPVSSLQDAEDYVSRLRQSGRQFDQIIDGLERRLAVGIVVPKIVIDRALPGIDQWASAPATATPFYTVFAQKLGNVAGLATSQRTSLLKEAQSAIEGVVLPAYGRIAAALRELYALAPDRVGVGQYPNGDAYYAYLLRHYTGGDLTAEEIHTLGVGEVARLRQEIEDASLGLGFLPEGLSIPAIFSRATTAGGTLTGSAVVDAFGRLIATAQERLAGVIDPLPSIPVTVVGVDAGGYYRPPAGDGSRPGAFYASTSGPQPRFGMPTLAYHETLPGHHVQIASAMELDLPLFRQVESFLGYTEGWALYSERLASDLGWYADDPYGNLGRLADEMMRAVRLVVDTGIHAKGWTAEEAISYFVENTGKPRAYAENEIYRYIVWPGQSTAYMVGMLHLLDLRRLAQERLGDGFSLVDFHRALLGEGNVPLLLVDRLVEDYIRRASGG